MRVMITRPRLEAASLAAALEALAVESLIEPLLHIQFIEGAVPNLNGVQALLVTSANGIRAFDTSVGDSPPGSRPPPRSAGASRGLNGPVAVDTPAFTSSPTPATAGRRSSGVSQGVAKAKGPNGPARRLRGIKPSFPRPAFEGQQTLIRDNKKIPVYTVGDASARAARGLGFASVTSASGDVESLAGLVVERLRPEDGALLHIAGTKVAGDLAGLLKDKGFAYRREMLYRAQKAEAFSDAALGAFRDGGLDGILFFSPRTAKTFVNLARAARLEQAVGRLDAYCLSGAVADEAGALAWRSVRTAARPEQSALLDLFKRD